jgi:hypothetical protein
MALSAAERKRLQRERAKASFGVDVPKAKALIAALPRPKPYSPLPAGDDRVRAVCGWIIDLSAQLDAAKIERLHRDLIALEAKYNPPPPEPVRVNEDANDGFGPRVLTPHEQRIAALRATVPTVKLEEDDIPFS